MEAHISPYGAEFAREGSVKGSGVILRLSQPFLDELKGLFLHGPVRHDSHHPYM